VAPAVLVYAFSLYLSVGYVYFQPCESVSSKSMCSIAVISLVVAVSSLAIHMTAKKNNEPENLYNAPETSITALKQETKSMVDRPGTFAQPSVEIP